MKQLEAAASEKGWPYFARVLRSLALVALIAPAAFAAQSGEQLLAVVQADRYGFIDHTGRVVIKPQFIWADDFWRGLGTVYVCGHYVSIDANSTIHPLRSAVPGLLEIRRQGPRVGFVDERGQFAIPARFDNALPFSDGRAAVQVGDKWGFIDTTGRMVIPPSFSDAYYFREGVAHVQIDSEDVLINRSGQVIASGYELISGIVNQGRIPVTRDGKGGYLDLEGRIAIPLAYDDVRSFSGGLAEVKKGNKWGYIDRSGQVVIPFQFDSVGSFGSGLAPIQMGDRTVYINTSGKVAFELRAKQAASFLTQEENSHTLTADSDVARFWTSDGKFGYVNTSGRVIWGPVDGSPFHGPLFGWSEEEKAESCRGISEPIKAVLARLFPR